jgi:hypothetical protein
MPADSPVLAQVELKGERGNLRLSLYQIESLALRNEVTYAIVQSEPRAVGAALGLCSPVVRKHAPWRHQDVLQYGQLVLDWALSEGVGYHPLLDACRVAWRLVSADLIPEREVAAAEDFSAAGGDSTSS